MMLFGEKYPDPVRMVSMGEFSKELCGGTHLTNTAQVEAFEVLSEESVSSGTRRVTALTGQRATEHRQRVAQLLRETAGMFGCTSEEVPGKTAELVQTIRRLKKQLAGGVAGDAGVSAETAVLALDPRRALRQTARALNVAIDDVATRLAALIAERKSLESQVAAMASSGSLSVDDLLAHAVERSGKRIVVAEVGAANPHLMRQWIDQIRKAPGMPSAVLLIGRQEDKVTIICGLSRDLVDQGFSAGKWVAPVSESVGGGGGGKADLAQAGGKWPEKIPEAIDVAKRFWT
jgi:alanyl-tRNA synthetase